MSGFILQGFPVIIALAYGRAYIHLRYTLHFWAD